MFGQDRICGVVAAPTAAQAETEVRNAAVRYGTRILELRLDYLRSPAERAAFFRRLPRLRRGLTLIATCRSRRGGGRFAGRAAAELAVLAQAVRAGCQWCDIELEVAGQLPRNELHRALSPARILVSAHDFRRTPRSLGSLVRRLGRCGGDAVKVATACGSLTDTRRLLDLVGRRRDVVVVPMGDDALAARVLALREGSALAYASIGQATAPGQVSLDSLQTIYRLGRRFGASRTGPARSTRIYGVIGNPIGHSLSPLMHNAAFAERKVNAILLPFHVKNLRDFVASVEPLGIAGFGVTLPHKQAILRYLDDCDSLAAQVGAVNTVVVRRGGRLYGYNTDYVGVLRAIERRVPLRGSRVLLMGAGGAARAAAFALAHAGAVVAICARRPARARALARAVAGSVVERPSLRREFFDAIVNCTPVGMHPGGGSPLQARELNCRVVMDLIYRPRKTELLRIAERRGIEVISGAEMFVAQGVAQWEIWNGERAPEAAMRSAVNAALDREERKAAGA
jgi:3-dehydroquinate dehydratase/shikimate dehydrogenase